MKRLLALMLCAVSLGVGAQTEYPYPYNPDGNNDGFINLSDLLDLLVLYNTEFSAGVLTTDSTSAIFYTGQMDFWDCASSCVSLTGNWKVLDKDLVGAYKYEISSNTPNDIVWLNTSFRSTGEAVACYTGSWGGTSVDYNQLWQCYCQTRTREDIDEINLCEGSEDECGVCNGPGAVYDCGCSDIPEGDCDCEGNQLDAIGICGGDCLEDTDGDGVCDPVLGPCEGQDFVTYHGYDYEIVEIGSQCWFAEDLRTALYSDGTPLNSCDADYGNAFYVETCDRFNYDQYSTLNPFNELCPTGWRVPSYGQWSSLLDYCGGQNIAAVALKSTDAGGTNSSGFSCDLLSSYYCDYCNNEEVLYRTTTTFGSNNMYFIYFGSGIAVNPLVQNAENSAAVRCIKDTE